MGGAVERPREHYLSRAFYPAFPLPKGDTVMRFTILPDGSVFVLHCDADLAEAQKIADEEVGDIIKDWPVVVGETDD
jgi:hypothetical protein